MTKMDSIIVSGASGFIGRYCVSHLLAAGYHVHALSHSYRPTAEANKNRQLSWHSVDLLDKSQTSSLLNKLCAEKMLHLAWYAEPGRFWDSPLNNDWLDASLHILQEFEASGGKRFVGAGSCAEYDWKTGKLDEFKTPLNPATLYGSCKAKLFARAEKFSAGSKLEFAWGRIFWLYGPGEDKRRIVPYVINSLIAGQTANCSSGMQKRDFLYIDDVARAFTVIVKSNIQGPINIGSGQAISIKKLVETIGALLKKPDLIKLGVLSSAAEEPPLVVTNAQRLVKELDFRPGCSLEDGLLQSIKWWKEEQFLKQV